MLEEMGLAEIEIERRGVRIRITRSMGGQVVATSAPPAPAPPPPEPESKSVEPPPEETEPAPAAPADLASHPGAVIAPMVGTAYLAPEPGATPFVKQGDKVQEGQTLVIIEAMKTMNPIAAPKSGTVAQIVVADAQAVEFGEVLFIIE